MSNIEIYRRICSAVTIPIYYDRKFVGRVDVSVLMEAGKPEPGVALKNVIYDEKPPSRNKYSI